MSKSSKIEQVLADFVDPWLQVSLGTAKALKSVEIEDSTVSVTIKLGYPVDTSIQAHYQQALSEHLQAVDSHYQLRLQLTSHISAHTVQANVKPVPGVKNIIAIGSGKGGVGKSTTSINLAVALQRLGARVGLLDADIYGPNQPHMLGICERPEPLDDTLMKPVEAHGLQTMSIGYLIDPKSPAVWRGPMVTKALQQLLFQTKWHDLDYLIVDLPPGTGDVQLTLAQKIPVAGAVVITTPQTVACLDAAKGIAMFEKVKMPVLGVIENMSQHVCAACGHAESIFGEGGGQALAENFNVPLLGQVALARHIREQADKGEPMVVAQPEDAVSENYRDIALRLVAGLSLQTKNYQSKFPTISVEMN